MKNSIIFACLLMCNLSNAQDGNKKSEAKLASSNVAISKENPNTGKPELKMVDRSTAKKEKDTKKESGEPELKLISKNED